jgi:penicillin-binding protein 1A
VARIGLCALVLAQASVFTGALALGWHILGDRRGLPDLEPFLRFDVPVTGHVYDSQGQVLAELARERRSMIAYDELPEVLRDAILSAEDKRFFSHPGVDLRVLPRVLARNLLHDEPPARAGKHHAFAQGGSTITQQLVRGWFLADLTRRERNPALQSSAPAARLLASLVGAPAANGLVRKVEEVRLALWLERELERRLGSKRGAKEAILARYASWVYLGRGGRGFAEASRYYFGRSIPSFTAQEAPEAALLAGFVQFAVDPADARGKARSLRRRNRILSLMVANGWIAPEALPAFLERPLLLEANAPPPCEAPGVVRQAIRELSGWGHGLDELLTGRVQVRTTVDVRVQALAVRALERGLEAYEARHPGGRREVQGAIVVLRNRDAAVLAEVGGRLLAGRPGRYTDYDRATEALRQPGSAMKPIVYLAALRAGYGLDSPVLDGPISVPLARGRWKSIRNYDGRFLGVIPLREAMASSRNAATVWLARQVGMARVLQAASQLGIETPLQPYLSTSIGASEVTLLELASAYRAMATGLRARPHVLLDVRDRDGLLLRKWHEDSVALDPTVWPLPLLQEGLRGVVRFPGGTAHALDGAALPVAVMGKTGTTNEFRDALFVGSSYGAGGLTVAVRIGFDDGRSLGARETGARAALPVFREVMELVYAGGLAGPAPKFPPAIESGIDAYLRGPPPDDEADSDAAGEEPLAEPPDDEVDENLLTLPELPASI